MRAHARIVVARDARGCDVVQHLRSDVPIVVRHAAGALYLVGGAAGPLGGDELHLEVQVGPRSRLAVRSVAASLVLPGPTGERSRVEIWARVGEGACLDWQPEPVILVRGCHHELLATVETATDARVCWREELVAGRHGEDPGRGAARLDLTRAGRPVLRQELRIGDPGRATGGPAVLGGARCVGTLVLLGDPRVRVPATRHKEAAARTRVLELEAGGSLVTSVGSPGAVRRALDDVAAALRREWW